MREGEKEWLGGVGVGVEPKHRGSMWSFLFSFFIVNDSFDILKQFRGYNGKEKEGAVF